MNKNIDANQETELFDEFADDSQPVRRAKKRSRRRDIEKLLDARQLHAQISDIFEEDFFLDR